MSAAGCMFSSNRSQLFMLISLAALMSFGCRPATGRRSLPVEVEEVIATVSDDIAAERYDKVYNEASDLWRRDSTAEQSAEVFKTLRTKLGKVTNRNVQSAIQQSNSGGTLKGNAYIVTYQTKFERGDGMETFTLIEQNGRWLLARYFVNSTELK